MNKKSILITGSSRGIGRACAKAYAKAGYHVFLNCVHQMERLEELAHEILSDGGSCTAVPGDVSNPDEVRKIFQIIKKECGGVDILINNAGITHRSPTLRTQPEVFSKVMAVDYHAPLNLTLNAPPLLQRSRGRVICIGSMAGWMPVLGRAGYCAAKAALSQAFEVLRLELERQHIGLLIVYPSFLDTPIERNALGGDVLTDAFGIVAMVAMTPLVTIQCLGAFYQWRLHRTVEVTEAETSSMPSEDIIEFDDV